MFGSKKRKKIQRHPVQNKGTVENCVSACEVYNFSWRIFILPRESNTGNISLFGFSSLHQVLYAF